MATKYFTGRAEAVFQVSKIPLASAVTSTVYSVTMNNRTLSYTAESTSAATVIAALTNAINQSAIPEFREVVATTALDGIILTARIAGVPFVVTAKAGASPITVTETTSATGPLFWNAAGNWSGGTAPSSGDDLIIESYAGDILYGLTDTNDYDSLTIAASFTGRIGLPALNTNGYPEYRLRRLTLGTSSGDIKVVVGQGFGAGSSSLQFDFASSEPDLTIHRTSLAVSNSPSFDAIGFAGDSVAKCYGGSAKLQGTFLSVDVYSVNQESQPVVDLGTSTVTTLSANGGTVRYSGTVTTVNARNTSNVRAENAATSATVIVSDSSVVQWDSSGNVSTMLEVQSGGKVDFGKVATTKTVTACKLFGGGSLLDTMGKVTFTNKVVLQGCRIKDVTIDLGVGYSL